MDRKIAAINRLGFGVFFLEPVRLGEAMKAVLEAIVCRRQFLGILQSLPKTLDSGVVAACVERLNSGIIRNDPAGFFETQSLEQEELTVD
jgi:hypothetical protein